MKNRHFWKQGIGLLAALALLAGLLPMGALAAPAATAETATGSSIVGKDYSEDENAYEIYPVPHSVTYPGGEFTLTDEVNVVVGDGVDSYTTAFLQKILERFGHTMTTSAAVDGSKSNIVLAIDSAMTESDSHYDPYTLTAQDGAITITGMDTDCVYYGVATLQMMFTSFNGEKFLNVQIEDYSDTVFRGFIEGFYGGFTYEARESQMRAIRDVKGNMYVFASKTDPYHGTNWSGLYPTGELNQIKDLVDVGKETKVNYTWSVHIGKGGALDGIDDGETINETLYTQRLDLLKAKFQQLYDIGVRSFNILNDDYNSGTHRVQVKLLNDINAWLKEKGDCMPLIYCCAGYNTAWAGNGAELQDLAALDDDIYLYWTGSNVNSPITQDSVDWPAEKSGQPVVTWLNYPCSEHAKSGLFLGDISHYVKDANGLAGQYGILSNAIAAPEANKVAYFQLLSWAWNRENYTDYLTELWEDCFKYLQPEVYEAYLTIARNVSNCPNSTRVSYFPESEYIKDTLEAVQEALLDGDTLADIPGAQALLDELDHILNAIAAFRVNCANADLKTEMEPWLKSLESVITAAKKGMEAADALAKNDVSGAWNAFSQGAVALGKWDANRSSNPNYNADVMAKAGSLRLQPFANGVLDYVEEAMAQQFNPGGGLGEGQSFYAVLHGVKRKDDSNSAKLFDGNANTYASYHDGTGGQQQLGDYYGVDLGAVKVISAVDILQGSSDTDNDYFHVAALECSTDGATWSTLVTKVNSRHIRVDDLSVSARYVRLRLLQKGYGGKSDYWTHIREFTVTEKEELLYTNAEVVEAQEENSGGTYALTVSNAALAGGEYVGIRFPELTAIQTVTTAGTLPAGVTLEWSVNGETWTQNAPTQTTLMGYVRLRATAAATLANVTLTASGPVKTELSFVSSNIGVYSGAWTNVVDGDRSTLVHTNARQEYGQYAIFDLSGVQPIHDVTVWIPESGDDIPHNLDVFVGNSAEADGSWELLAELRDNHYDMDVPYRYFHFDGGGAKTGRYIKLAVANVAAANWIKINELEVNTTVSHDDLPKAVSATSGDAGDAVDGNLLTFLTPDGETGGTWTKLLQAPTAYAGVTVLRGADGAAATVEVEKNNAWQQVGTLSQSATTIDLSGQGAITGLRVSWTAGNAPAIAEVIFSGEAVSGGEVPAARPNIYEQPASPAGVTVDNGTALEDVGLPATVLVTTSAGTTATVPVAWSCEDYTPTATGNYTFTGTFPETFNPGCFTLTATVTVRAAEVVAPAGDNLALNGAAYASGQETAGNSPDKAVDGNSSDSSRWNSNYMKVNATNPAWLVVDLGANVESITGVTMRFHNLVWPTDYKVQVAGPGFTPVDYSETNGAGGGTLDANTFAGNNGENAGCWTTVKTISNASYSAHPTVTIASGDFDAAVPAGTRYIRLYFTGINSAAAGHCVSLWELTVNGTRGDAPVSPNVASVAASTVTGATGTAWSALELPTKVTATLSDDTTAELAVTWDNTGYDPTLTTPQTFTGTLTLADGMTNTGNVTAALTVTLTAAPGQVDKGALTAAITAATGAKTANGLVTKPAGTAAAQVTKGTKFVTQDAVNTLDGAIAAAQAVADKADATQAEVDGAVETLNTAAAAFNAAIQTGEKEESSTGGNTGTSSGSSSGPAPAETTKTETREDGTKVTTVTAPDGTVTETVKQPDGTTSETVTTKDGDVTITVTDADGEELVKTEIPATIPEPETKFVDIDDLSWAVEAINNVAALKLVNGVGNNKYDPTTPMTRGQIAAVLHRLSNGKTDYKAAFKDVQSNKYYAEGVAWAAKANVVKGVSTDRFAPDRIITREQMATMLCRYAKLIGMNTAAKAESLDAFVDGENTGSWAVDSMAWCVENGILKGKGANNLDPTADVTRAEVAVMLDRFIALIK